MPRRLFVTPYKMGSKSAVSLSRALVIKRSKAEKTFKRGTVLINWGRSDLSVRARFPVRVINKPSAVALAANKLSTFQALSEAGVNTPEFTTDRSVAMRWLEEGEVVYARTKLSAHSGVGLVVVDSIDNPLPVAPMYTKGIVRSHEYRVHVVNGQVVDYTKKRRRSEVDTNPYVKNLNGGWVFCREGIELPSEVQDICIRAVAALGLDFGAVDVVTKQGVPAVIEINTAPGLEGTTLVKYTEAFNRILGAV